MKIKKWLIGVMLWLIFLPIRVGAEETNDKVIPKHIESGGIKLESKVYDWNQYEPVTYIKDSLNPFSSETIDKAFNQTANFFFSLTKIVASLVDTAIDKLYSLSLIDDAADDVANVSQAVYENLYESIGIMLIIIAVVQIFYYYSTERSGGKAGRTTITLLAVIAFATIWFSNASYYTKAMNSVSNEIQGLIMKAGTPLADKEIQSGEEFKGSLAILRNSYFNLVVKKSYLIMNYGTPDEKEIKKDDKKDENRINDLLQYKTNKEGYKKREDIVKLESEKLENIYMSPSTLTSKVGVAFCSFLFSLILGIPLLVLAFLSPGIQILILVFSLIFGISLLLSLLPYFANSGWKNFEKIAGLFVAKAFIGLAMLFIFVVVQLMEKFIPSNTPDMYMLNIIATAASMYVGYKFRDKIIATATGGRITAIDGGAVQQMYERGIKQPAAKATEWTKQIAAKSVAGPASAAITTRSTGTISMSHGNAAAQLQARNASRSRQHSPGKAPEQTQKKGTPEAPQVSTLARLRKRAVNMPADIKDKLQTAKEAVKEDVPLQAQHKVATVKDKAKQAKENVVNMPKRMRNTMQEDQRQGQIERSTNATERQKRRAQLRAELKELRGEANQPTQSDVSSPERKETVRTSQEQYQQTLPKQGVEASTPERPVRRRQAQSITAEHAPQSQTEQQKTLQTSQVQEPPQIRVEQDRNAVRKRSKE
ncbi:CD3337/EF1877 family mobilome membrane protein [Bacillus cereus]|uniref:CD3337/EF1877 family mobilome membrane protein n=1 Tax=Bacillus cereus TaxID=1396 RepID=UPI003012BF4E